MTILLLALFLLVPGWAWADVYYLSDTNITTPLETLATSAPSSADSAQGWTVANKTTGNYCLYRPDTTITRTSTDWVTSEPSTFGQRGYRTSAALNGSFSNSNWTLDFKVRSNTYYAQKGYVKFKLWRSANADGSSATQITNGWQSSSLIGFTAANQDQTGSIVWSPGARVNLTNEYLFLEIEWSCNTGGGNNGAIVYWKHNEGSAEKLTTPVFAAMSMSAAATLPALTSAVTASSMFISEAGTLPALTSAVTAEVGPQASLSVAASLPKAVAVVNMGLLVTMGGVASIDMGAFETGAPFTMTLPALTANIDIEYPNTVVRPSVAATIADITADIDMTRVYNMSIFYVPADPNALIDKGAYETFKIAPFTATAEITMTTNYTTDDMVVTGILPALTSGIIAKEGASISGAGTLAALTAGATGILTVSLDTGATVPKLASQVDMERTDLPFLSPVPGMGLGLNNLNNYPRRNEK